MNPLNNHANLDVTFIVPLLFIVMVAVLLGAVMIGTVSTNMQQTITDNTTNATFERVDSGAASAFTILGTVGFPLIIGIGFLILLGVLKLRS